MCRFRARWRWGRPGRPQFSFPRNAVWALGCPLGCVPQVGPRPYTFAVGPPGFRESLPSGKQKHARGQRTRAAHAARAARAAASHLARRAPRLAGAFLVVQTEAEAGLPSTNIAYPVPFKSHVRLLLLLVFSPKRSSRRLGRVVPATSPSVLPRGRRLSPRLSVHVTHCRYFRCRAARVFAASVSSEAPRGRGKI